MTASPCFQILVRDVSVTLPVAGWAEPLPCLINLRLGTSVRGPFTGDPDDVDLTVDYSRIVRHIIGPFRSPAAPFADAPAVAAALAAFIFALDGRILTARIGITSPATPQFHCQCDLERPA